eukprot:2831335-Pyramimonas_sp.AAC.1
MGLKHTGRFKTGARHAALAKGSKNAVMLVRCGHCDAHATPWHYDSFEDCHLLAREPPGERKIAHRAAATRPPSCQLTRATPNAASQMHQEQR